MYTQHSGILKHFICYNYWASLVPRRSGAVTGLGFDSDANI